MQAHQAALLETLRAVQKFLDDRQADVAPINESGARRGLDEVVVQFTAQSVDQRLGIMEGKGETTRQAKLRKALRVGQMLPIANVAQVALSSEPRLSDFAVPVEKTSSTRLIAAADAMAAAAKPYESVFLAGGLPEDFIAQLQAAAAALLESLNARTRGVGRARGATRALPPLVKRARATLRVLDSLVTRQVESSERLLGEWRAVKAVPKKPGPAKRSSASHAVSTGTPDTADTPVAPAVESKGVVPVAPAVPAASVTTAV